jgi:hypothetical protein
LDQEKSENPGIKDKIEMMPTYGQMSIHVKLSNE